MLYATFLDIPENHIVIYIKLPNKVKSISNKILPKHGNYIVCQLA